MSHPSDERIDYIKQDAHPTDSDVDSIEAELMRVCGPGQFNRKQRALCSDVARLCAAARDRNALACQIGTLATFILAHVPGEPSQFQGVVDTAVRVISELQAGKTTLLAHIEATEVANNDAACAAEQRIDELQAEVQELQDATERLKRGMQWLEVAREHDAAEWS